MFEHLSDAEVYRLIEKRRKTDAMEEFYNFTLNKETRTKRFRLEYPYLTIKIVDLSISMKKGKELNSMLDELSELALEVCASNSKTSLKNITSLPLGMIIKQTTLDNGSALEFPKENFLSEDLKFPNYDCVTISISEDNLVNENYNLVFKCEFDKILDSDDTYEQESLDNIFYDASLNKPSRA